ncbi:MAG TPA: ribonuclease P protein component [Vicinamibacterales bacterium]|jgi:ribonuclease P protein component
MRHTFRRDEHIRRRGDFQRVYERGKRVQARHMTVFLLPTELPVARLGIAATRKIGGSVQRNLAKRLIREIFRRNKPPRGTDVVVIPRTHLTKVPLETLEADYQSALTRQRPVAVTV